MSTITTTKTHNDWMQETIELAFENTKAGGKPFGCIITTKDGKKITDGVNEVVATHDVTAHAELVAIRKACIELGTSDLSNTVLYASGECCPMCLAAVYWAKIDTVFYSYSDQDEAKIGLATDHVYAQLALPRGEREIVLKHIPRDETTNDAFKLWMEMQQLKAGKQ